MRNMNAECRNINAECRNISVLLAAYCGEAYIAEQIASILPQLEEGDELLVGDDSPAGHTATKEAVLSFADPRIEYLQGPGQGTVKNIEFLLGRARGALLVLSDQDDVWLPGKLAGIRKQGSGVLGQPAVILHDARLTDEHLHITCESQFEQLGVSAGFWRNLVKNTFTGCCMALTRELLPYILPFPAGIPMHDQWIGLRAIQKGRVILIREPLILHRRHPAAQTGQAGSTLGQKIRWRAGLVRALMIRR